MNGTNDVAGLFQRQLHDWKLAADNYAALNSVKIKEYEVGEAHIKLQFNPARIISSAAKVDAKSIKARRCFLCGENRPAEQDGLQWGSEYMILINPYPIFPRHLTIPNLNHVPQQISGRMPDMMRLAAYLDDFIVFYNGPRCGASAPDHFHFQAGNKGFMTFDSDLERHGKKQLVKKSAGAEMYLVEGLARRAFVIYASSVEAGDSMFECLYKALPVNDGDVEPMLNILCWYTGGEWRIAVFPRVKHRPDCYFAEGEANILITPASVDMGGVFIAPLEKDFEKVTSADIKGILDEVCISEEAARHIVDNLK